MAEIEARILMTFWLIVYGFALVLFEFGMLGLTLKILVVDYDLNMLLVSSTVSCDVVMYIYGVVDCMFLLYIIIYLFR